jgi:hypothetical protein
MAASVGIIGFAQDPQVRAVSAELSRRGANPLFLPADALNRGQPVSSWDGAATYAGTPLSECKAIYVRSMPSPHAPVIREREELVLHADWFPRFMQARERSGFLMSLLLSLEHAGVRLVKWLPQRLFFQLVTWALLAISIKLICDGVRGLS